jgi:hypothetical protein
MFVKVILEVFHPHLSTVYYVTYLGTTVYIFKFKKSAFAENVECSLSVTKYTVHC